VKGHGEREKGKGPKGVHNESPTPKGKKGCSNWEREKKSGSYMLINGGDPREIGETGRGKLGRNTRRVGTTLTAMFPQGGGGKKNFGGKTDVLPGDCREWQLGKRSEPKEKQRGLRGRGVPDTWQIAMPPEGSLEKNRAGRQGSDSDLLVVDT